MIEHPGSPRSDADMRLVDLDDARTWTTEIRETTKSFAEPLRGTTEYTADLSIDPDREDTFRLSLQGTFVKVYHATRLLDHEAEDIRNEGLTPASQDLVERRIATASDHGYVDDSVRDGLLSGNLFGAGEYVANREGMVCFFASRSVMDDFIAGIWSLMTTWGGEIVYFGSKLSDTTRARLKVIGRPAIVVAAVELSESWRVHYVAPGVANAFVGKYLGFTSYDFDLHYRGRVPGEQILDIWMPSDPQYDGFPELPRR